MLVLMPVSMPMDTMSLAVLPSPSPSPSPSHAHTHAQVSRPTAHTKRPKLSLNTASLPSTFGKSSTGLRLDTPSIASPTTRNTFSNAYGQQHVSSPQAMTPQEAPPLPLPPRLPKSRLSLNTSVSPTHQQSTRSSSTDSLLSATSATSASTESSFSSASTVDSYNTPPPYRLTFNHNSILSNGPHGCVRRRKPTVMFPSPKKVSFRAPLTEDIRNEKFTMAHSDIESSSSSISTLELPPSTHGQYLKKQTQDNPEQQKTSVIQEPNCGDKRDSSSEDDSDSDICPSTPITRRSKRPREWVWTLGPINTTAPPQPPSPVDVKMSSPIQETNQRSGTLNNSYA